jgi:CelD/BcsL family acetyltransferase involved in cellulose biosynthesis
MARIEALRLSPHDPHVTPSAASPSLESLEVRRAKSLISVRVHTGAAAFAELAVEWNRLHAETMAASVFNSWMCQYEWWQVYGGVQPLRLLVAEENGKAVGILPVYVQVQKILGTRVRVLRLIGSGGDTYPDDLGPVLAAGREQAAAEALAEEVLRLREVDLVLIADVEPRSCFPDALAAAARRAGRACEAGASQRITYATLPKSWEALLASLSSSRRARMRGARRKLEAAHPARFFVWDDAAGLDRAVERLVALHRKRWQASGESQSFSTREYVEFHRRVIKACFPRGWLRLYCLEVGGEIAAMTYCYRFRNRVFLMQAGFDPELARWHPGSVLFGHALEHAIAEGNEVFDFLRGMHRYKDEVATGARETQCVTVYRASPGAFLYRARRVHVPAWKKRIKHWLGRVKNWTMIPSA